MQSLIINKGFIILEEHFLKFGYHFVINEKDHILLEKTEYKISIVNNENHINDNSEEKE